MASTYFVHPVCGEARRSVDNRGASQAARHVARRLPCHSPTHARRAGPAPQEKDHVLEAICTADQQASRSARRRGRWMHRGVARSRSGAGRSDRRRDAQARGHTVAVGDAAQGQLTITNHSTAPHDQQFLTLGEITLIPSCSTAYLDVTCTAGDGRRPRRVHGSADRRGRTPARATAGSSPSRCRTAMVGKRDFASARRSPAEREWRDQHLRRVVPLHRRAHAEEGREPALDGMQTNLLGFVDGGGGPGRPDRRRRTGASHRRSPDDARLFVRASQPVPTGGSLIVAGTLTATHPTGSVLFELFGPGDPGCTGAALATDSIGIGGNGTYQSPPSSHRRAGPTAGRSPTPATPTTSPSAPPATRHRRSSRRRRRPRRRPRRLRRLRLPRP